MAFKGLSKRVEVIEMGFRGADKVIDSLVEITPSAAVVPWGIKSPRLTHFLWAPWQYLK